MRMATADENQFLIADMCIPLFLMAMGVLTRDCKDWSVNL